MSTVFKSCSRSFIAYRIGSAICTLYNIYNAQSLLTSAGESPAGSICHLSNIFVYCLLICQRLGCVSRSIYRFKRNVITIGQLTYGCGICAITYHRHSLLCSSSRNIAFISISNTFYNLVSGHGSGYIASHHIHNRLCRLITDSLSFRGYRSSDYILQVTTNGIFQVAGYIVHQLAAYRVGHISGTLAGNVGPFGGHIPGYHVIQVSTHGVFHIAGYIVHQLATYGIGHIGSSVIYQCHSLIGNTAIGCRICNICRALINRCGGCTISYPLNNLCHSLGNIRLQIS